MLEELLLEEGLLEELELLEGLLELAAEELELLEGLLELLEEELLELLEESSPPITMPLFFQVATAVKLPFAPTWSPAS